MAYVINIIFITCNDTGTNKFGQSVTSKMTETAMPKCGGCSEERRSAGGGCMERVEVTGAIAPGDHVPGLQVLHRKAKRIKLDGAVIIGGKTTNRNQILNDVGRH
jgi:hypothetical protein